MNYEKENNSELIISIVFSIIAFGFGILLGYINFKPTNNTNVPTPVEKEIIDTLYITRDNIITKVKYLDNIKHDTIKKVYNLDDSTTLQLFLQLVSE